MFNNYVSLLKVIFVQSHQVPPWHHANTLAYTDQLDGLTLRRRPTRCRTMNSLRESPRLSSPQRPRKLGQIPWGALWWRSSYIDDGTSVAPRFRVLKMMFYRCFRCSMFLFSMFHLFCKKAPVQKDPKTHSIGFRHF